MKTTKQRLTEYRQAAADFIAKYGKAEHLSAEFIRGQSDWRAYRYGGPWVSPNNSRGDKGQVFSDSLDQYGKNKGDAGEIVRLDHTGWFADHLQDELIRGAVAMLRCPRGVLYIPVSYRTESEGSIHYMRDAVLVPKGVDENEHEQGKRDAAHLADRLAELEAEDSREWSAKEQAENDKQQARSQIHETNRSALALIKEIKQAGSDFTPAICSALRSQLTGLLRIRADNFNYIEKLQADFWAAVGE